MKIYFPYDIENPQTVIGEPHRIVSGKIRLLHVPLDGSIEIAGFTAAKSRARLLSNEFFCEYRADTLYREANRIVYFNADNNFRTVYVSYKAVGSPFTCEDANEIREFMAESRAAIDELRAAVAELKAAGR